MLLAVYGPQKGADKECLELLESGMDNYLQIIKNYNGMDMNRVPGSGAAGGLGAALVTFFGARLKSGIDTVLDFVDFDNLLKDVDFVVTGEGKIDSQSAYGKVPVGIAKNWFWITKETTVEGVSSKDADGNWTFEFAETGGLNLR